MRKKRQEGGRRKGKDEVVKREGEGHVEGEGGKERKS